MHSLYFITSLWMHKLASIHSATKEKETWLAQKESICAADSNDTSALAIHSDQGISIIP